MRQITMPEAMIVPAMNYAIGRMTYVVADTCEIIRDVWINLSKETRYALCFDLDEKIDNAEYHRRYLGMSFDHGRWLDLCAWMYKHLDEPSTGRGTITCDESMVVSVLRYTIHRNDDPSTVIATIKECWPEMSTNYHEVIQRDIAADVRLIDDAATVSLWTDFLHWTNHSRTSLHDIPRTVTP